ncbi:negative cofactor 2 transcription regulator complex subunit [Martiniozyma asiatica (nom. inval.)]|nr:negative cofactor 2 transcription regulator complex subunit [Martiniozyma asiatica]
MESFSESATSSPELRAKSESYNTGNNDFIGKVGFDKLKTHFPSARVKKLMQSDEDIGKVSQATPLVVGRALELFMCALVEKSVELANETHSKKVNVQILNKVIQENEDFDFLEDVCAKYLGDRD